MVGKCGQLSRDKLCRIWDKAGIRIAKRRKQANHKSTDGRFEYAEAIFSHVQQIFLFAWDIIRLVITRCVLDHTLPVTQLLQSKGGDIVAGLHLIQSLKNLFVAMRNEIDQYHDRWYKKVIELANKVDVIESKPRTCGRQVHRGNAPATSISEYYKRNITIPL